MILVPPRPHAGFRATLAPRRILLSFALAGAVALGACTPTEGDDGEFDVRSTTNEDFDVEFLDVGIYPIVLGAADIDGDGMVDIAVSNRFDDTVTVFTDGLEESATIATGLEPTDVVFGNLDDANGLDLAVLNEQGTHLSLYMAEPDGGWSDPVDFDFEDAATQVSLIDLNGDGTGPDDLIVSVTSASQLWAFVNDGAGSFTVVITGTNTGPTRFVTGDYNGDDRADVAVLSPPEDVVTVHLGDGTGAFSSLDANGVGSGNYPIYIVQADFDEDGDTDFAVVSRSENRIALLLGDGTGLYDLSFRKEVAGNPDMIVTGAFDTASDGPVNDVAFIHLGRRRASLLTWNQSDRFDTEGIRLTENPITIAKGDFNLDGCLDVLTTESTERLIGIAAGDCTGEFTRTRIGLGGAASFPLVTDLDSNGTDDVVLVQTQSHRIIVLRNQHDPP